MNYFQKLLGLEKILNMEELKNKFEKTKCLYCSKTNKIKSDVFRDLNYIKAICKECSSESILCLNCYKRYKNEKSYNNHSLTHIKNFVHTCLQ
jgi:hypothetical protein